MLLSLHIKNYALIDDLRLELTPGLNIFTGETGAGKSIIIDSIGSILGERASAQVVRKGASRCFVTGEFDCARLKELKTFLADSGTGEPENDTLILRREIDSGGKSRAFVNDLPVSIETLRTIGEFLVDVHGQHDHQTLLKSSAQRELLDRFGDIEDIKEETARRYSAWRALLVRLDSQHMSAAERERLIDLYSFQCKEIEDAALKAGEEEEIARVLPLLKNAEKLFAASEEAHQLLYGVDGAAIERLGKAHRLAENIHTMGGNAGEIAENLQKAYYLVEEASRAIETYKNNLNLEPDALERMLEREDLIHRLKKKYGHNVAEIIAYRDKIAGDLEALSRSDSDREELEKDIAAAFRALSASCEKLSTLRKKAATALARGVEKELNDLGMKKARFSITVEKEAEPSAEGWDHVECMFSANAGDDVHPLKAIASGGEMSRVMLALKTVFAKADRVPVLIFDEIDAGVGGPMGQTIGKKLSALARHHQILCITHLPQIAAFGARHLSVEKETVSGRTTTKASLLSEKDKIEEIARMLSGETVTAAARRHAAELINSAAE